MQDLKVVTVYINPTMYHRFFTDNPQVNGYALIGIDNRPANQGLPTLYNEVIAHHLDQPCWLLFVHEDFEIKSGIEIVGQLDRDCIYGTFGVTLEHHVPVAYGRHTCSEKDGSSAVQVGMPVDHPKTVQTLDCQSILVHTSLLARHPQLRFDEALSFDLFAEEFCIQARTRYDIDAKVFPLAFQHYSHGNLTEGYHEGLRYLAEKYPDEAVAGSCSFIGGRAHELEQHFQYDVRADPGNRGARRLVRVARRLIRRVLRP